MNKAVAKALEIVNKGKSLPIVFSSSASKTMVYTANPAPLLVKLVCLFDQSRFSEEKPRC